jgi:hypothetical protein
MTFDWKNPAAMGMTIAGVVLLFAALIVDRFVPPPSTASLKPLVAQIDAANSTVNNGGVTARNKHMLAKQRLWPDPDANITPAALSQVNTAAQKWSVKVTAFRPEKAITAGSLNILPYLVTVQGTYANCMQFEHEMEENDPQLAVSMLQIASADSLTSGVTASITLNAYVDPNRPSQQQALASSTSKASGKGAAAPNSAKPGTGTKGPTSTGVPKPLPNVKSVPQTSVSIDNKPANASSARADRMNNKETTHG